MREENYTEEDYENFERDCKKWDLEEEEKLKDPEYAAQMEKFAKEGAEYQNNSCIIDYSEPNESIDDYSSFKTIKAKDKVFRLAEITNPIVGVFEGVEPGKFSLIYRILTDEGLVKVYDCHDLKLKMNQISCGTRVYIALSEIRTSSNGKEFGIADVRVAK